MADKTHFDVLIIGGSYSGLSAAMALGRSLRDVLVIDSNKPCNRQTPRSHNFLTQDGRTPKDIALKAKEQVEKYETVQFYSGIATKGNRLESGFEVHTESGDRFTAKKLIFATGVKDIMPDIDGFSECWGISVIHCPYCHGYEVRNTKTGILGNGEYGFEFSKMIQHWTKDLTLYTNGKSTLTEEQTEQLKNHNISINENEVERLKHQNGQVENIHFKDGSIASLKALYAKLPFDQHCDIPMQLGCELNEQGYLEIDSFQKTAVNGIYACGDNTTFMRSVSNAVAMGTAAGAMANREMIEEDF